MLDALPTTRLETEPEAAATAYDRCQVPSGRRPGPHWFVVAAYPKAERRAHAALHLKGFEAYLPLITFRWADRTWHTGPLFPGYLFVRLDLTKPWHPVHRCPGVFDLLAIEGIPTPCPDAIISTLQATEALRATPQPPSALWAPGMPCSLGRPHAMSDLPAVVTAVDAPRETATVAIMMLGYLRSVTVPLDCLTKRDE